MPEFKRMIRVGMKIPPKDLQDRDIEALIDALDDDGGGTLISGFISSFFTTLAYSYPLSRLRTRTPTVTVTQNCPSPGTLSIDEIADFVERGTATFYNDEVGEGAQWGGVKIEKEQV